MMFNRLRTIWPKGYQHGSPWKSHQKGDYLKTSNAKKWLFLGFCAGRLLAGPPRGGKRGETMTPVPMEFRRPIRGPMGFKGPLGFRRRMEMTPTNQFVEYREPFFGGRSHQNPKKIVAFSSFFLKFAKLEMPNI